jgi:hypothetical protein
VKVRAKEVLEAVQWNKHGDHPDVTEMGPGDKAAACCGRPGREHGHMEERGRVCPGEWLLFWKNCYGDLVLDSILTDEQFRSDYEIVDSGVCAACKGR